MRKLNKKWFQFLSLVISAMRTLSGYGVTKKMIGLEKDPYSSSKAAAEILLSSYARSLINKNEQKYFRQFG